MSYRRKFQRGEFGRNDGDLPSEAESQDLANLHQLWAARPLGPTALANGSAIAAPSRATRSPAAILLLGPDTEYPDHSHEAEELYLPLAGHALAAGPASCSLGRMLEGMKSMAAGPYGFWTSPITSDLVVADSIRLEQVALDSDAIYWTETQPQKQGRTFVYRIGADGKPERVTPEDADAFSVRTRAHEYGGGAFVVSDGVI
jgi:dimethlysulfoniopropionate lyase